jgi:hypothetical protein
VHAPTREHPIAKPKAHKPQPSTPATCVPRSNNSRATPPQHPNEKVAPRQQHPRGNVVTSLRWRVLVLPPSPPPDFRVEIGRVVPNLWGGGWGGERRGWTGSQQKARVRFHFPVLNSIVVGLNAVVTLAVLRNVPGQGVPAHRYCQGAFCTCFLIQILLDLHQSHTSFPKQL